MRHRDLFLADPDVCNAAYTVRADEICSEEAPGSRQDFSEGETAPRMIHAEQDLAGESALPAILSVHATECFSTIHGDNRVAPHAGFCRIS